MSAAPPGIEIRPVRPDELPAVLEAATVPFAFDVTDELTEWFTEFNDAATTLAAFDGDQIVGTAGAIDYRVTVPGGTQVPTAGITLATVLPTHRRRGVLSAMMHRHLRDARDRGQALAALWASEEPIYGRFGFGEAVPAVTWTLERRRSGFRSPAPPGSVHLVDRDEALRTFPAIHDAACRRRHGSFVRTTRQWESFLLFDPAEWRKGATARRHAVYREGDDVLGYVVFRSKSQGDGPSETVVLECHAMTNDAYLGLWRFIAGVDLAERISAQGRPVDEPLRWHLADRWAMEMTPAHGMWIRLVDVPRALAARTYRIEGSIVIDVTDAACPWNAGRYELIGSPDGAVCRSSSDEPDLALDVAALGSVFLGGRTVRELADAGMIEGSESALARAGLMVSTDRPPWSAEEF